MLWLIADFSFNRPFYVCVHTLKGNGLSYQHQRGRHTVNGTQHTRNALTPRSKGHKSRSCGQCTASMGIHVDGTA